MPASYDFLKSNHASTLQKKKQQNIKLSTSHKTCFKMHKLFLQSYFNLWLVLKTYRKSEKLLNQDIGWMAR